jgi:hypothetical protein
MYTFVKKSKSETGVMIKNEKGAFFWVPQKGCRLLPNGEIEVEDWVAKPYRPAKEPKAEFVEIPREEFEVAAESEKGIKLENKVGEAYWFPKSQVQETETAWKIAAWVWEKKTDANADEETVTFKGEILAETEKGTQIAIAGPQVEECWFSNRYLENDGAGTFRVPGWVWKKRSAVVRP